MTEETSFRKIDIAERIELERKIEDLHNFVAYGEEFPNLNIREQELLVRQSDAMLEYWVILKERMDLFVEREGLK